MSLTSHLNLGPRILIRMLGIKVSPLYRNQYQNICIVLSSKAQVTYKQITDYTSAKVCKALRKIVTR